MGKQPAKHKGLIDYGQHRRILLVMLLLGVLAFLPVGIRLYSLMVLQYDDYASLALRNQLRTTMVTADRGNIYDRNMNLLAGSQGVENIYLSPRELSQSGADLQTLSEALGDILQKDPQWIREKAENRKQRYQQIGARVPAETGDRIRSYLVEQEIRGVHLEPGIRRAYPFGTMASQVIGFTDNQGKGVEGIELSCDGFLRGEKGRVMTTMGNNEMDLPYSYENFDGARGGCDVVLTLDTVVQQSLEKQLERAMDRYQVSNGAFGLVMNCKTGEILAMATLGGFDPNDYQKIGDPETAALLREKKQQLQQLLPGSPEYEKLREEYALALQQAQLKQWRNRVIADGYEPGSTFKVLTMAAALDTGAIDLNTDFYCSGAEQIPGRAQLLHCWRHQGHGAEKTAQALQNSCNIAFAHIALKLGGEDFYDYVKRFGILEKTGIDLKGESKGVFFDRALITDTEKWGTASLTSGSFGQTFKLTPLQLVRGIASVVNGGKLVEPYLVSEVLDSRGNPVYRAEPTVVRTTVSSETSRTMRELIRSVVTEGTARNAAVAGYSIGGKTGTGEKIDVFDANGQRVRDKIVSFVGIAPMDDPEYIVLAALDTPSYSCGTYVSGGAMAAPTVGAILEEILPYLGVPREPGADVWVPIQDLKGLSRKEAEQKLSDLGLKARLEGEEDLVTGQIPTAGQSVPAGGEVILYLGRQPEAMTAPVPDFLGLNRQQASELALSRGFLMEVRGNPELSVQVRVVSQSPAPGEEAEKGTAIILKFTDTTVRE